MDQCDDIVYLFKRYNVSKKLNLNFLRDPPPLPECVIEEMVEAYKGEDGFRPNLQVFCRTSVFVRGVPSKGAGLAPLARPRIRPSVARDKGGFIGSRKGDMG
ncbi:hypothetical protein L3X38_026376 [Prunus dulcis]|uniref:Uncharacterized protein n=1 Tax=Prunus dulcis TaxID=3755 RepID=A0AAD4YZE7_PRUDU|nr:hypothetical protein L3X38_026376 [Prunus dulcis]